MSTALRVFQTKDRLEEVFKADVVKFSDVIGTKINHTMKCIDTGTELVYYMTIEDSDRIRGLVLNRVVYEEVMDVAEDFELMLMSRMNV